MRTRVVGVIGVAVMLLGVGAASADRVLLTVTGKALDAAGGIKAGATCKITVTTAEKDACPVTCSATATCGATKLDLGPTTSCGLPDNSPLGCPALLKRHVFSVQGEKGSLDAGDGLAGFLVDDEHALVLTFAGGRTKGDPEGKPAARLREKRTLSVDNLPAPAPTCTVELDTYPDLGGEHSCETACLAHVTCGALHVTRSGTCDVPYRYTNGTYCYGAPQALKFEDRAGDSITIGGEPDDRADGTFTLGVGVYTTLNLPR